MKLYPNCKINLGLRVVRKRADGYHDIETIFVPIYGLHDELEIKKSNRFSFRQEGLRVDCAEEDNLLIKCYRMFAKRYDKVGNVSIRFKKKIPFGAGLGGGSSDAAHMAIALNELFELGLSKEELARELTPLGADCPFFVYNRPCFAEGIGERLRPIEMDLRGTRVVLIKPDEGVSTKEAYEGLEIVSASERGKEEIWVNDFEKSVFPKHPAIEAIKKRLLEVGAYYASMSGSGSTVFGFFKDDAKGRPHPGLRILKKEFSSMILLNDSFGEWKS